MGGQPKGGWLARQECRESINIPRVARPRSRGCQVESQSSEVLIVAADRSALLSIVVHSAAPTDINLYSRQVRAPSTFQTFQGR